MSSERSNRKARFRLPLCAWHSRTFARSDAERWYTIPGESAASSALPYLFGVEVICLYAFKLSVRTREGRLPPVLAFLVLVSARADAARLDEMVVSVAVCRRARGG